MKLATLTAVMLMSTATYAFAGGGAPVPEGTMNSDPSGRPGKILDEAACTKAWETANPDGDTLSKDKATPYVLNFEIVDSSKDAKISAEEWKDGCSKGWISADAQTADDMKGTPAGSDSMDSSENKSDGMNKSDASDKM